MTELEFVHSLVVALAEFFAIYFLTGAFLQINTLRKSVFVAVLWVYEMFSIINNLMGYGVDVIKWLLLLVLCLVFMVGRKDKDGWNLLYFFCNIQILRSTCQIFKFVFLTFYSDAEMDYVMKNLEDISGVMTLFYVLFYIPGFFCARYLWKQLMVCRPRLLHSISVIICGILVAAEVCSEWVQILLAMPSLMYLLAVIVVVRIEAEKLDKHKLSYYKDMENQIKEMDEELAEIRREVEKYYQRAGEVNANYAGQLLQKIDDIKSGGEDDG